MKQAVLATCRSWEPAATLRHLPALACFVADVVSHKLTQSADYPETTFVVAAIVAGLGFGITRSPKDHLLANWALAPWSRLEALIVAQPRLAAPVRPAPESRSPAPYALSTGTPALPPVSKHQKERTQQGLDLARPAREAMRSQPNSE
jgi:hypothetical protein